MEKSEYSNQIKDILNMKDGAVKDERLKKLAEDGDAEAQEMVGALYFKGEASFKKSLSNALHYFKLAAEQGKGYSQYMVFRIMTEFKECSCSNIITEQSVPFQYLLQSAENKHPPGNIAIAYIYTFSSYWEESDIEDLKYQIPTNFEKAEYYLDLLDDERIDENAIELKYGLKEQIQKLKISFEKQKDSEGCYIATAVYGSYNAKEVLVLRRFRDEVLQHHFIGKCFVKVYYLFSPPVARYLKNARWLNMQVRKILNCLVNRLDC